MLGNKLYLKPIKQLTFPELHKFDVMPIVWSSVYLGLDWKRLSGS